MQAPMLAVELYSVVTVADVLLAWVQPDPRRVPRVLTHLLTEPVQRPLRWLLQRVRPGSFDISPLVVLVILGMLRVWMNWS